MNSIIGAVIIIVVAAVVWYIWHRVVSWRRRIRQETYEARETLHTMFDTLRGDVSEQFDELKKNRPENESIQEERAEEHIKDGLDVAERFAQKEIEDIEKEVE